jgi:hypothetical protein
MKKRQAGILLLALMMVLSMVTSAFAVSGAADSDSTDYITNRTGNSTAIRQENSSNTGVIRLGKILTVNQQGKFPNIEDFVYKITPVAAWENANESTSKSGVPIPPREMPIPGTSDMPHHSIVNIGTVIKGGEPWSALVSIGNFKDGSEDNTSSIYGDAEHNYINSDNASNNELIAEGMRRTRVTDVAFNFYVSGYYMYKIEEVGSSPNGSFDDLNDLRKDVAGVDYDDNTYYVVFYVCNKEVKGDTVNGTYVHTITSWTNNTGTDFKPDNSMRTSDELADAQNWLHDLMESQDVDKYSTDYGDGGHPADLNTGGVENDNVSGPSTVVHNNLGKVGISTPQNPNYLEAYRMWNGQVTHDVVLKKNVTGNLGDLTKEFVFEVTLTGLESNQTYTTDVPAVWTDDVTSPGVEMYDMTPPASLAADGKSFTTDSSGAVTFKVKLKDDDVLVLNALPRSASYRVKEQASDHVAQYNIESSNNSGDSSDDTQKKSIIMREDPVFAETSHTPGGSDAMHLGKANDDANKELSTETEFVDRYDDTVTITFQNNRDLATLTGITGLDHMVYAASLAILSLMVLFIVRRRREYAEEERIPE